MKSKLCCEKHFHRLHENVLKGAYSDDGQTYSIVTILTLRAFVGLLKNCFFLLPSTRMNFK